MTRESMTYDVIIIGAGPAGLSAAIRYAQLCHQVNHPVKICVLEKGAEVGAHLLSGAVFEPRALSELLPDWPNLEAPIQTSVTEDHFQLLTAHRAYRLPTPPQMNNRGNFIISLGLLCRWLAEQAQKWGVDIYPGFAATQILYHSHGQMIGVQTGDMGRDRFGAPKPNFQPGINLYAKQTLLAEGCRGSLSQQLIEHYGLAKNSAPQTYGMGLKEIWEIDPKHHQPGKVIHTVGWPLDSKTYGGGFIYHWDKNLVSIGFVVGLDYENPYFSPYDVLQQYKHHPKIQPLLQNGRCLSYGARALNEGGWQSLPKLTFPGGMLIGCSAGFLNVPKIKGSHNAMKSGMLAAESVFEALQAKEPAIELTSFQQKIKESWIAKELYLARNIRPAFRLGLWGGLAYAALDTYLFRGKAPWTLTHPADYTSLKLAKHCQPLSYPKPDGKISFDKMTSVSRAHVAHEENQPCHLRLKDPTLAIQLNWEQYQGPEARYCPAGVYEFIDDCNGQKQLIMNASNCIHCKTCDIKDPAQNIVWTPPEGGGGPNYSNM